MKISHQVHRRFFIGLLLLVFSVGCEKPGLRPEKPKDEVSLDGAPVAGFNLPAEPPIAVAEEQTAAPAPVADEDLPPEEPELSVAMTGNKITINGAVKSSIQQERIVDSIRSAFPDHEIVADLKLEYHREPVGWGNRVADEFLIPYLQQVKFPEVAYKKGVVTLKGEVDDSRMHKRLTEMGIEVFSGSFTRDFDNQITVKK